MSSLSETYAVVADTTADELLCVILEQLDMPEANSCDVFALYIFDEKSRGNHTRPAVLAPHEVILRTLHTYKFQEPRLMLKVRLWVDKIFDCIDPIGKHTLSPSSELSSSFRSLLFHQIEEKFSRNIWSIYDENDPDRLYYFIGLSLCLHFGNFNTTLEMVHDCVSSVIAKYCGGGSGSGSGSGDNNNPLHNHILEEKVIQSWKEISEGERAERGGGCDRQKIL